MQCTAATSTADIEKLQPPFIIGLEGKWLNHFLHKHGRYWFHSSLIVLRKVRKGTPTIGAAMGVPAGAGGVGVPSVPRRMSELRIGREQ